MVFCIVMKERVKNIGGGIIRKMLKYPKTTLAAAALTGFVSTIELPKDVPGGESTVPMTTSAQTDEGDASMEKPLWRQDINAFKVNKTKQEIVELRARIGQLQIKAIAKTPKGYKELCNSMENNARICKDSAQPRKTIPLTYERFETLQQIDQTVNSAIKGTSDKILYGTKEKWVIDALERGAGDCEDYALAKWRILVNNGFPPRALLMAIVENETGLGHAVLVVRTNIGDLILDNLIKVPTAGDKRIGNIWTLNGTKEYGYTFHIMQDPDHLPQWNYVE